jgi:hypothetical protein
MHIMNGYEDDQAHPLTRYYISKYINFIPIWFHILLPTKQICINIGFDINFRVCQCPWSPYKNRYAIRIQADYGS